MFFKKLHSAVHEENIILNTRKGFEQVYHLYAEQMFLICYHRLRDKEIAKEIVQDIFKSLWERREELKIKGPLKHYLLRATKLELIDYFRTQERQKKHLECAMEGYCEAKLCTEEELEFNELLTQVSFLVDRLPCQCREVYKLSREKGLTNKEIASTLLISEKTVEAHMSKALQFLRKSLSEYQF